MQIGRFEAGMFGYPIRVTMNIPVPEVVAMVLTVTRPNRSKFTRNLAPEAMVQIVPHAIVEYMTLDGDIPASGTYQLKLVMDQSANRRMIAKTSFEIG